MSELFDAAFFARLNRLKLAMHIRLDQGMTGGRKSSAKGSSVEFSDFREYLPGDDIRRIDWNVYGRLDKLYVKQFMEEKEAFYHIFIDTSASMDFGEQKKSVMALRLAAVFAWIAQRQLDRVELYTFAGGRMDKLSPVTGRSGFDRVLRELEQVQFAGTTDFKQAIHRCSFCGRGICIVLSDFFDPSGVEETVRYLVYQRQSVLLVSVLAREEVDFDEEGTLAITDLETEEQVRVTLTRKTIDSYRAAQKEHERSLEMLAKRYGCAHLTVISDEELDKVVFETLKQKGIFG